MNRRGFTLVEMLVGSALFLVIAAEVFAIFGRHTRMFQDQQNISGLNVSLRNAVTQIQLDLMNAGAGVFVGANVPDWPVGVTIVNTNPGASCFSGGIYGANCFDALNIISADANSPALHPQASPSGCMATTATSAYAAPGSGLTALQTAAYFKRGDQLLFVSSNGAQIATTVLTADASVSGTLVRFSHSATYSDGTNSVSNDPLAISTHLNSKLAVTFCNTDWVLRLAPVSYSVDTSTAANPKLVRTSGGISSVLSQQILGFRIGAALWNGTTDVATYNYTASSYSNPYDFTIVRSVRVSIIGRTTPSLDPGYRFRNSFDSGAYQVQGISVVASPRNLSMRD